MHIRVLPRFDIVALNGVKACVEKGVANDEGANNCLPRVKKSDGTFVGFADNNCPVGEAGLL
tara:strand:+ start:491 stop:676 length:186 start_codon:yes stop_codon:yes gene_type:complete